MRTLRFPHKRWSCGLWRRVVKHEQSFRGPWRLDLHAEDGNSKVARNGGVLAASLYDFTAQKTTTWNTKFSNLFSSYFTLWCTLMPDTNTVNCWKTEKLTADDYDTTFVHFVSLNVTPHTKTVQIKVWPCYVGMARPRLAGGDGLQVWRGAVNILNKQLWKPARGGPPSWGFGEGNKSLL
jgi:hypothetical protein